MKLKEIKTAREVLLPGIRVEFVIEGTALKEVILQPEGEEVSYAIKSGENYTSTIKLFERLEYETKTVTRLSGTFMGLKVQEDFDNIGEANRRIDELGAVAATDGLMVKPAQVKVDETGFPLSNSDIDSDIPF